MTVAQNWYDPIFEFVKPFEEIIIALSISVIGILVIWILWEKFLLRKVKNKLTPTQHNAMRTLGRAVILLLGLFWIGGEELFIGSLALMGTAIGFASSSTIGNFISGLYLLITNPFDVGDYIILPNLKVEGIVEEISINYTSLLTPEGVHTMIANQKLIGTVIKSTEVTIKDEAIDKGKISWKDHEGDKFDSVDDVVDILRGFRTKFANQDQKYYLYPLEIQLNPDKYLHTQIKTILDETCKEFHSHTSTDITWFMKNRSTYQMNLIVTNPYVFFDLKSDIFGFIEEKIEESSH